MKHLRRYVVLRVVSQIMIPLILLFAFYIQFHGKYSPGGGFQAGAIGAAAFILYSLVFSNKKAMAVLPRHRLLQLACAGPLIYGLTGVAAMLMGGEFLNYSAFDRTTPLSQYYGVAMIEVGVGITVFAVMMGIWHAFATIQNPESEKLKSRKKP